MSIEKDIKKRLSIIIPVVPGGAVGQVLASLKDTEYPRELMEVFIVEGRQPSKQRNKAIEKSTGEIVYFFDNDCIVDPGIFINTLPFYEDKEVAVVGGPSLTPDTDSFLQKCFSYVLESSFGAAGMRYKFKGIGEVKEATEKDLILCNLSARLDIIRKNGAFNESLYPNEENELFNRLVSKKYKLIYNPNAIVYRSARESIAKFIKQLFRYGRGRIEHIFILPSSFNLLFIVPSIFVIYLFSLLFKHNFWYVLPLILYVALDIISSLRAALEKRNLMLVLFLPMIFPVEHISYGFGVIWGFIRKIFKITNPTETDVAVRKVDL